MGVIISSIDTVKWLFQAYAVQVQTFIQPALSNMSAASIKVASDPDLPKWAAKPATYSPHRFLEGDDPKPKRLDKVLSTQVTLNTKAMNELIDHWLSMF